MKHTLEILPRQIGKTTYIANELTQDVNAKVILFNTDMAMHLCYKFKTPTSQIINHNKLTDGYYHRNEIRNISTLFVDEYCFMSDKITTAIWNLASEPNCPTIHALSTPKKRYKRSDIENCRMWWKLKSEGIYRILKSEEDMINFYGKDLLFNLLVHPNCKTLTYNRYAHLPKEQIQTEILGNIYAD